MRPRRRPLCQGFRTGPCTPIVVYYTAFLYVFLPLLIFILYLLFSALLFMVPQHKFDHAFKLYKMERKMQESLPA